MFVQAFVWRSLYPHSKWTMVVPQCWLFYVMWGTFHFSLLVRFMLTSWGKVDCCCHIKNSVDFPLQMSVRTDSCVHNLLQADRRVCTLVLSDIVFQFFNGHEKFCYSNVPAIPTKNYCCNCNVCSAICMSHGLPRITVTKDNIFCWPLYLKTAMFGRPTNVSRVLSQC